MSEDSSSSVGNRDDVGGRSVVEGSLHAKERAGAGSVERKMYGDPLNQPAKKRGQAHTDGNFNPGAGWQNGNNDTKEMHGRQIENRQFISLNTVFVHLSEHS